MLDSDPTKWKFDERWLSCGVTPEFLIEQSGWLAGDRNLHSGSRRFFELAGRLVSMARFDYFLVGAAFFHTVLGLEKALKLHYKEEQGFLRELLNRAVADGLVHHGIVETLPKYSPGVHDMRYTLLPKGRESYTEKLVTALPDLRNQYFHGTFILSAELLYFALHVRGFADALVTRAPRT